MPYIYKITNSLNGKIYIGKTMKTVAERWQEHCRVYNRRSEEHRPLYAAMNKYGIDSFTIETIEECSDSTINEREQYWIEYFGSFKNGYNATIGGDGRAYIDYDLVVSTYAEVKNQAEVARIMNISRDSVNDILKTRNVPIVSSQDIAKAASTKIIHMYDKNTQKFVRAFATYADAANWLIENKYTNCKFTTIRYHVSEVCHGKRKSTAGFVFKEINSEE